MYGAMHDGAAPEFGTFRTSPRGRATFTFTSFGDQGTPTLGKKFIPPAGVTLASPVFINDNLGSPAAGDTTLGVERLRPLFHLFNGDLCYANLAADRVRTWWDFWDNNTRSARNRPWMPSPGNHENELGNGPIGYQAYQTYFSVPEAAGQTDVTRGLWYAFTAGSVRVVSIANDDICYQDGGNSYVRGYSGGAQKAWLEKELAATRENRGIDWIVVCMHQVAISTADKFNGADLGIREEWVPLFDKYGVDLVVCGHEHHYERSHPVRGAEANRTLTPKPAALATDVIDTTKGTVHMVIGGGGTSVPSNDLFFNPPACRVIVAVGASADPATGKRAPVYVKEDAPWSAVRNAAHAYGFAAFTVDPGAQPSGLTTMKVVYYDVVGHDGQLAAFETFTLQRPRRDSFDRACTDAMVVRLAKGAALSGSPSPLLSHQTYDCTRANAHSLLPSGSRRYARYIGPAAPWRMPGGSSTDLPPLATPALCQASACSGPLIVNPTVPPLAQQAAWPSIGLLIMKRPPL